MVANRMFLLHFGPERIQKSMSVRGATDETLREPIFGAVVETDLGWVLLDTGISRAALADPPALTAIYGAERHPIPLPGSDESEPVELALVDLGENASAHVLPGHDPVVWAAAWHPRDGHC